MARRELNEAELISYNALMRYKVPFRCHADNAEPVIINGNVHFPDFVTYTVVPVEVDGFFQHNHPKAERRRAKLIEDCTKQRELYDLEKKLHGSSSLIPYHDPLQFWAHEVKEDPYNNFAANIINYARAKGLT